MAGTTFCTASSLRAILQFIDPQNTPKIAGDDDSLAIPLIEKIKSAVGDRDGSQNISITFGHNEAALERQFVLVIKNIFDVFKNLEFCTRDRIAPPPHH